MDDILTHSSRQDHTGYLIDLFKAISKKWFEDIPKKM